MVSFSRLSLAAAAASAVSANPVSERSTFSLETKRNAKAAGVAQHRRSQAKYSGTTGSTAGDYDSSNGEWISIASIGTPPQELPIILDSGSWDLVVYSSQSDPTDIPANTTLYEPDQSSTARYLKGYSFDIIYGNGDTETEGDISCSGDVYLDVVTIGGVTAPNQAVESIVNFTEGFATLGASGIVGMALSKNNTVKPVKQHTFFSSIHDQLEEPVFVADLYLEAYSHLDFGFINESLIDGPITWTPVDTNDDQQGWWSITIESFKIGDAETVEGSFQTIVDTGTTNNLFQADIVDQYYAQVPNAVSSTEYDGYIYPCSEADSLPDFTTTISGKAFTVPGSLLTLEQINSTTCFGNIQAIPAATDASLPQPNACLGATFMLQHLVAFDLGSLQLGIAQKAYVENATFIS